MGVESNRIGFTFSWDRWVILGLEVKAQKLGASRFTPTSEEGDIILDKHCYGYFSITNR